VGIGIEKWVVIGISFSYSSDDLIGEDSPTMYGRWPNKDIVSRYPILKEFLDILFEQGSLI